MACRKLGELRLRNLQIGDKLARIGDPECDAVGVDALPKLNVTGRDDAADGCANLRVTVIEIGEVVFGA